MKQIINIFIVLGILLFLHACDSFSNVAGVGKVPEQGLNVLVKGTVINPGGVPVPNELAVKLTNFAERYEVTAKLNVASGQVSVGGIIPGIYTISISGEMEVPSDNAVYLYSGNAVNVSVTENNQPFPIDIKIAKSGAILIKEIFYAGSRDPQPPGASTYRDQFWEFYNNSSDVQYLDGLHFGPLQPTIASATDAYPTYDPPYDDPNQWVFSAMIWKFPGTGMDYPLQPGESAIIAQMALNHQNDYPYSPINAISAEFEFYSYRSEAAGLVDNPAPNMEPVYGTPASVYLITVVGPAVVLFRPPAPVDPNFNVLNNNPSSKTNVSPIHVDWVIDAVETVGSAPLLQRKRMTSVLDAGGVTVGGTYNRLSVSRKVREVRPDGRIVLWDTNNSTEDFYAQPHWPMIRRHNPGIPAWNTWYTLDPQWTKWFPKWVVQE